MQFFDFNFWQDFVSNLSATLIGVALGIPIAIWISKRLERISETERKTKILRLLRGELLQSIVVISGWRNEKAREGEARMMSAFLRNESWRAFSEGGELQWIKDPELVDELSEAYFIIRSVSQLSERYALLYAGDKDSAAARQTLNYFGLAIDEAKLIIQSALEAIADENIGI